MSTRCQISFEQDGIRHALIYKHSDGYPDSEYGMFSCLNIFFKAVSSSTRDTRFSDPEYLATKFVVFLMDGQIDCLGVGISIYEHSDIEYLYTVKCSESGQPSVSCKYMNDGQVIQSPFNSHDNVKMVRFDYLNKEGGFSNRLVKVTEETKTFFRGFDLEKNDFRTFSKNSIKHLKEVII